MSLDPVAKGKDFLLNSTFLLEEGRKEGCFPPQHAQGHPHRMARFGSGTPGGAFRASLDHRSAEALTMNLVNASRWDGPDGDEVRGMTRHEGGVWDISTRPTKCGASRLH